MRNVISLLLCLSITGLPNLAAALSSDRNQPMNIEADRANIDDKRGISVYQGNVKITQGSLLLTADELTVTTRNGDIINAVATGQPATYRQQPDNKPQAIDAEALRIEYLADQQKVILLQKAKVQQGGDTFLSDRIHYDIAQDKVNAGDGSSGDRVRITIQPKETQ